MEKSHLRPREITRNLILTAVLIAGGSTAIDCSPTTDTTPHPTEILEANPELNQFEITIMNEVKRRGIEASADEQAIFQNSNLSYNFNPNTLDLSRSGNAALEKARIDSLVRFGSTGEIMSVSKNKKYRTSQDILGYYIDQKIIDYDIKLDETGIPLTFTSGYDDQGLFHGTISVDANFANNQSNSLNMADQMVHLASLVDSIIENATKIPEDLSPQEKNKLLAQLESPEQRAKAYAQQAEAYIQEVGLIGKSYALPASGVGQRTAKYIDLGMNPTSPEWIDYIENG